MNLMRHFLKKAKLFVTGYYDTLRFSRTVFCYDEAWFTLCGSANSKNTRIWSTENPHKLFEKPLHGAKIGLLVEMSDNRIFFTFFGETSIAPRDIKQLFRPFAKTLTQTEKEGYYQQDGASAHTAGISIAEVEKVFGPRIISRTRPIAWPPRSPDLTPPDFYM